MNNLSKYIISAFKDNAQYPFVKYKQNFFYREFTYQETYTNLKKALTLLDNLGLKKDDKIVIFSNNSIEWIIIFFAALLKGVIVVPLNVLSSKETIQSQINEINPSVIFTTKFYRDSFPNSIKIFNLEELFSKLEVLSESDPEKIGSDINNEDLAEILYTSGTTSKPKGAMITRGNIYFQVSEINKFINYKSHIKSLSVLPFSHIYEQVSILLTGIQKGGQIYIVSRPSTKLIKEALQYHPIEIMNLVPEALERVTTEIYYRLSTNIFSNIYLQLLKRIGLLPKKLRRAISYPVRRSFCKTLQIITSGGAKTNTETLSFWFNIGIDVYEGYGATETTSAITISLGNRSQFGTSGRIFSKDTKIKIADDGEILVKGNQIFKGYFNNPALTKSAIDQEGYYDTGDIGNFDKKNNLILLGRQKYRIVLGNGEKVYPEDIETKAKKFNDIKEICVFGFTKDNNKTQISAVIVLQNTKVALDKLMSQLNSDLESSQRIANYMLWPYSELPKKNSIKLDRDAIILQASEIFSRKNILHTSINKSNTSAKEDNLVRILSLVTDIPTQSISLDSLLTKDLNVDSLKRLSIITLIEEEFSVEIVETQINDNSTVKSLIELLDSSPKIKPQKLTLDWQFATWLRPLRHLFCYELLLIPFSYLFINLKPIGLDNINKNNQYIFTSNHPGPGDLLLLQKYLIRKGIKYFTVADRSSFIRQNFEWFGEIFKLFIAAVPTDLHGIDIKEAFQKFAILIDKKFSVVIVPAGHYTYTFKDLYVVKEGVTLITKETSIPIVPVYIDQNYTDVQSDKSKNPFLPRRPHIRDVYIVIGKPYYIASNLSDLESKRLIASKIVELKDQIPLTHRKEVAEVFKVTQFR